MTHTIADRLERLENYLRVIRQEASQEAPDHQVIRALSRKSLQAILEARSAHNLTTAANRRNVAPLELPAAGSVHPFFTGILGSIRPGA